MSEFFEVVRARRSVRAFEQRPVEADKLQAILDAANRAPSAGNLQAYEIYLVTNRRCLRALAAAALGQDFVAQAPLALVFCAHAALATARYGRRGASLYCVQDATIACTFAMLAAVDLGLGTVWVGAFRDDQVQAALGLGNELQPVAMLPIGYAAEKPEATGRRRLDSIVRRVE